MKKIVTALQLVKVSINCSDRHCANEKGVYCCYHKPPYDELIYLCKLYNRELINEQTGFATCNTLRCEECLKAEMK